MGSLRTCQYLLGSLQKHTDLQYLSQMTSNPHNTPSFTSQGSLQTPYNINNSYSGLPMPLGALSILSLSSLTSIYHFQSSPQRFTYFDHTLLNQTEPLFLSESHIAASYYPLQSTFVAIEAPKKPYKYTALPTSDLDLHSSSLSIPEIFQSPCILSSFTLRM
jgi:hypothetical protein